MLSRLDGETSPEELVSLSGMDAFTLLAIPLFILAGTIMGHGGIARRIVNLALIVVGRVRGGLGFVVILATMFFSGVCGSASADTAAIGSTTMPEMLKRKYPREFATALLAASGATASIIPPSIDLIIIGVVAGISIGGLFAAGILPGVVNALALMALCYYYGRRLDLPVAPRTSWSEKMRVCADGVLHFEGSSAVDYENTALPYSTWRMIAAMWDNLAPDGGGKRVGEVSLLTPASPLGQALVGKREGDAFELRLAGRRRECEVLSVE